MSTQEEAPRRPERPKEFRLVLPFPPSVNSLRAIFTPKRGRARLLDTEVARVYKAAVRQLLQQAGGCLRWTEPLLLEVDVFRPRRVGDLANAEKVVSDALQTEVEELRKGGTREHPGLFDDDGQTVELRMRRYEDKEYPRVQVTVRVVEGPSGTAPERWAPPPGWAEALGMVEAAQEKRRSRERVKRAAREERKEQSGKPMPAYLKPLPAGSTPGVPSYGSRHFPNGTPTKRGKHGE